MISKIFSHLDSREIGKTNKRHFSNSLAFNDYLLNYKIDRCKKVLKITEWLVFHHLNINLICIRFGLLSERVMENVEVLKIS